MRRATGLRSALRTAGLVGPAGPAQSPRRRPQHIHAGTVGLGRGTVDALCSGTCTVHSTGARVPVPRVRRQRSQAAGGARRGRRRRRLEEGAEGCVRLTEEQSAMASVSSSSPPLLAGCEVRDKLRNIARQCAGLSSAAAGMRHAGAAHLRRARCLPGHQLSHTTRAMGGDGTQAPRSGTARP